MVVKAVVILPILRMGGSRSGGGAADMSSPDDTSHLTDEQRRDLELLHQVRPYLRKCLDLNHDIGNPLAGIMGYSELLLAQADQWPAEARRSLEVIRTCTERINRALEILGEEKVILAAKVDLKALGKEPEVAQKGLDELVGLANDPLAGQRRDEQQEKPESIPQDHFSL